MDEEIRTELTIPTSNDPRFLTYYFQTDFDVTAEMLAGESIFELYHFIDDGAVFHLNGQEFYRYNMPDGEITFEVDASRSVSNADKSSAVEIPKDLLKAGTNVLSIDVHLSSTFSNDIVMGAQIVVAQEATPLIPGTPYRENPEEWVELYNKGTSTVDVSGWQFDDGMNFEFPAGTSIPAGGYLVVSNDAATLRQKYPDIQIVGNFGGSLSNAGENIRLVDTNKNVVDSVHYYDSGKWPQYADGGASSLELVNPNADNNNASVWAASDESDKSEWIEYSYKGISLMDATERSAAYNEFIFGLLDVGEFLLDDVSVKENPSTEARELLQNGSFEADTLGESPATWRLIGNHSGTVIVDPTNPENQVVHVVATGAQAHIHDHAETTFEGNRRITDGTEYEISFRAKWVAGNGQLNNRLFFGRLSNTAVLDIPRNGGTPGAQNGSYQENTGPTYSGFQHTPATPLENQEVTVRVQAADSDGVQNVKLFWREDRGEWNSADMTLSGNQYQGTIPGFSSGTIVQFYVEGTDSAGNVSTFPADGADSRALYQVEDGRGPASPIDKFRLVMLREDQTQLFASKDRMSNWRIPVTVIHNNDVYYNVVVRMTGSRWIRPNSGYRIDFNPDEPLYGVHESVRFDLNGMAEIVMKQMLNRAGGSKTSSYDDIAYLVSPNTGHTHEILLNLARYENVFLDSQFENGSEGTKYELDDVTYPTSPSGGVEGFKTGTEVNQNADIGVDARMFAEQGQNPEFYRPHVLIKSNRTKDDYDSVVRMASAIHNDDPQTLFEMTNEAMDVDLWMRHYAHQAFFGNWDTYGFRRPKNLRMYVRPEDDRMIPLMWDCDLCNFSEPLFNRTEPTSRLDEIRAIPHNLRLFWGHMHDFVDRSFNEEYVAAWAPMFGALANNQIHGGDETFTGIINSTRTRSAQALREISRAIPEVDFSVTTADFSTDSHSALLEGKGWVNVRTLKIAGIDEPIDAYWPTEDGWQFEIPVAEGANTVTVEAYDFRGNMIGSDSVTITGTSANPLLDSLRITEVHFNPADPSPAEATAGFDDNNDFEFIEIANLGSTPISLDSVSFQQVDGEGVEFAFAGSGITQLEAGQRAVIVEDADAFAFRYGSDIPVAGTWSGGLGNGSEQISLFVEGVLHQQFTYDDGWYPAADGDGSSLEVFDTAAELDAWQTAENWRASLFAGGTPGTAALIPGDANRDGVFNSDDLLQLFQNGEFEDDVEDNSTFEEGDWNGDGDFTTADLVVAFQYGAQFNEGPGAGVAAVADRSESTVNPDLAQQRDLRAVQLDQIFADEAEQRRSVRNNKISGLFGDDEFGLFLP
ncbi:MAG: lamin tail domain-containing protein [Pirellulaceae bacterium]